jgi:replicative DNA helicase
LIFIDYLQLMSGTGENRNSNREQEISRISRDLKGLAKELQIPIIALSQLSREVEKRKEGSKMPQLSDLRECVAGDTLVWLADDRRVAIRELVGQSVELWSVDRNHKLTKSTSELIWPVGQKKIYELALASGRKLRASEEHRVLGFDGWTTFGKLTIGSRIAIARNRDGRQITKDENYFSEQNNMDEGGSTAIQAVEEKAALKHVQTIHDRTWCDGIADFSFRAAGVKALESGYQLQSDELKDIARSDIFWDKVVSVNSCGEEEVFDLTVNDTHNWIANEGIITHNSGAIEQDADMVMFLYRPEYYDITSNELGENNKGETHVRIAKHRNGSLETIKLKALLHIQKFIEEDGNSYGGLPQGNWKPVQDDDGAGGGAKLYIQTESRMKDLPEGDDDDDYPS